MLNLNTDAKKNTTKRQHVTIVKIAVGFLGVRRQSPAERQNNACLEPRTTVPGLSAAPTLVLGSHALTVAVLTLLTLLAFPLICCFIISFFNWLITLFL